MLKTNEHVEGLMTPLQLSEFLCVPQKTIYHWVQRREIPFTKIGRHLRFNPSEIVEHFRGRTEELAVSCPSYASLVQSRRRSLTT
jgi:excisionase family DNA binding protein